jgi:septum site-determining protein MinD
MGKVITLISGKGGVGKTTLTANIGIALAQKGKKVLLIDSDIAMANLSLLLGMQSSPITLHDVLLGESNAHDAIYDGPGGVSFIPSGLSLESYRRVDAERLEQVVKGIAADFDLVLLDAPAGIEKNVMAAISSADKVLLVAAPTAPAIADVLKAKLVSQRLNVPPIAVVVNFVREERGEITKEDIMKILELPVWGRVPYDDEVRKSFLQEKVAPVMMRNPTCNAAIEMKKVAARIGGYSLEKSDTVSTKKKGFFARLLGIFRRR